MTVYGRIGFLTVALLVAGLVGADGLAAQCYACKNGPGPTCSQGAGPYSECTCPCSCAKACGGGGGEDMTMNLRDVKQLAQLPATGVLLVAPPSGAELAEMNRTTVFGRPADYALVSGRVGLVRYGDDTWRAFAVDEDGSFTIRDCDGRMIARARPASGRQAEVLPLVEILTSL